MTLMPENIPVSFSRIITIKNLFIWLNRNMTRRLISEFKMSVKKIIDFVRLFHTTIVASKSSFLEIC